MLERRYLAWMKEDIKGVNLHNATHSRGLKIFERHRMVGDI